MSDDPELRFRGKVEASQDFTILDPVALIQKHEKEWLALADPDNDEMSMGYEPWERFAVFIHNLMSESVGGIDMFHLAHVGSGWDDFEVDFRWTKEMADRLDAALPEYLRSGYAPDPERHTCLICGEAFTDEGHVNETLDKHHDPTRNGTGPDDQPIPGLEP